MIRLLLLLITVYIPIESLAQWPECDSILIPTNAQVITTNSSKIGGIRGRYWVCSGLNVTITGDTNVVYVEKNCTVSVEGDSNVVYMKGGGSVDLVGEHNWVIHDTSTLVLKSASWWRATPCYNLNYYYQNAPTNGCDDFSGLDNSTISFDKKFEVWPNPLTNQLMIRNEFKFRVEKIIILNMDGRVMFNEQFSTNHKNIKLDVSELPASLYLIVIHTLDDKLFCKRVIKK